MSLTQPKRHMSKLIKETACKQYAKDAVKRLRPAWNADRVSGDFMEGLNSAVRRLIDEKIKQHPTVGKTLTW